MHRFPLWLGPEEILSIYQLHAIPILIIDLSTKETKGGTRHAFNNIRYAKLDIYEYMQTRHGLDGHLCSKDTYIDLFNNTISNQHYLTIVCDNSCYLSSARLVWTMHSYGFYGAHIWKGDSNSCIQWFKENDDSFSFKSISHERITDCIASTLTICEKKELAGVLKQRKEYQVLLDNGDMGKCHPSPSQSLHLDSRTFFSPTDCYTFKPTIDLLKELVALDIHRDRSEIYCFSRTDNHSSLAYCVLKYLGFNWVKGYVGTFVDRQSNPS